MKKMNVLATSCAFLLSILFTSEHIIASPRRIINLNEEWHFFNPYLPWSEGRPNKGGRFVNIPHDWSIEGPFNKDNPSGSSGAYLQGGKALYQKHLDVPENWHGKKVFIEFDGVYQNSEVFINGVLVGKRPNGWVSFSYEISQWLNYGEENLIAVRVTNTNMPNCRWYSGSGIYRPVRIVVVNPLHIKQWGVFVSTPIVEKECAFVKVNTTLTNDYQEVLHVSIIQQVLDEKGNILAEQQDDYSIAANKEQEFSQWVKMENPKLWDIDHPNLYTLKTIVRSNEKEYDDVLNNFGIRTIVFDKDKGFSLNGTRMKLKGVCLHHDAGMLGAAVPPMVWERRIKLLKEMGCNAIRTSHNPFDPTFYDLCDRMGMMVMDEAFDEWTVHKTDKVPFGYHQYWDEWHACDLTDIIRRDRNHPSIILWSVGNESIEQSFPHGKEIARELVSICHQEDPTRFVTHGNNKHIEANMTGFADEFDVVGYNYGHQFQMYEPDRIKYPYRKVIGTENTRGNSTRGYYAFPVPEDYRMVRTKDEYFSSYDGWTRKYGQENEWKVTRDLDYVSGMFIWTGIDYLGETSWPWPTKYSDFGVIDACGFPKDAYYFYKSVWNENEITLHLLPHWNWEGREGEITPVWCYTNCDEVELFLNGKSKGRKRFNDDILHLEWNDVRYEPGILKAIGYRKGKKVIEKEVVTTGKPYAFSIESDVKTIRANNQDVVHFIISVKDDQGYPVPDANTAFNVEVSGGRLLGIDNGDPKYVGSFMGTKHRTLFNGLALVIVQSTSKKENIKINISSESIKGCDLIVNVK